MASAFHMLSSAISERSQKIMDKQAIDEILGTCYEEHVRTLKQVVSIIRSYRDALVLDNKSISSWYMDLEDLMYAAIDVVDIYVIAVEKKSMDGLEDRLKDIFCTIWTHQPGPYVTPPLAVMIQNINEKIAALGGSPPLACALQPINEKINSLLGEGNRRGYPEWIQFKVKAYPGRPKPAWIPFDDQPLIGRDEDKYHIINWLRNDDVEWFHMIPQILPIVGIGGIGKTRLAQSIFSSEKHCFDVCGWVQFGTNDIATLLASIRSQFGSDVHGKTFLLVIDDVWGQGQQWFRELFRFLKGGKTGSKLIITTRNMEVVKNIETSYSGGVEEAVKLEGLQDEDMWKILKNYVFGVDGRVLGYADRIGRKIVTNLQGLPFAAIAIGQLLRADRWSGKHWERIGGSDLRGVLKSKNDVDLAPALTLSYLRLPPEAKPCFTHCSLYRERKFLRQPTAREMVYQWVALDYLQVQDNESVEDAGETIINYLEGIPLITAYSDRRWYLGMHDLVYYASRAMGRDDHLQLDDAGNIERLPLEKLRHLCIDSSHSTAEMLTSEESLRALENCKMLRTLILKCAKLGGAASRIGRVLEQIKSLRVLTLARSGIRELPREIGGLKHLRYLDLSYNDIDCLPGTMAELHHLQVLILGSLGPIKPLPGNMDVLEKLTKLRYLALRLYDCDTLPDSIASLSDLRVLKLYRLSYLTELPDGISSLKRLEYVQLYQCGAIRKLPEGFTALSRLQVLDIQNCKN